MDSASILMWTANLVKEGQWLSFSFRKKKYSEGESKNEKVTRKIMLFARKTICSSKSLQILWLITSSEERRKVLIVVSTLYYFLYMD
jgi:IS1 family transposase